ncbi:uncharacterized protein isoform X2 [Leptinotarsa decemlineata]|uniref:uncharacterized protein isoform X2 n=1 Tax=Leptinotarsa decemlineata TaxID=7539 RepID=UPI003D30CB6E
MNNKSARSGKQKKNNTKNTDNFSKDEVKDSTNKKYKSHSKQSREKPENVSIQSKRKSGRSKNESEALFKETSLSNPKKHVENENKIKKHRSRSSENFNQNSKVKPGHLRREKTIHVEKIRKYPHHKQDSHSMKSMKQEKCEEKEVRKHKHRSRSEKKSNQHEVVHHTEQLLFCQVENANPFKKTTTKEAIRSFSPPKSCKEKLHKVNDSNVVKENVHKRAKIDEHIFSPEVLYAHVHHKKNRPKLVVGRKPFKYSVLEPNSSSDHRKHRKLYKMSVNSLKNVQTKKNKRKLVENYSEDISPSTKPQFQEKIEDDLKSYFTRIQSLIDKKIDTLLQNYKSKIKLKGAIEEEIAEHGANVDYNKDSRHHHHEPRKKSSHRTSNKDKGDAKKKCGMSRRERSFQNPADRNCNSVTAPSRHSSPPERKCKTPPRCNSPVVMKHDGMLQGPSLKRKNHDTFANYSVPVFTHHEHPRQCSPTSKNEEMAQYSNSREKRNFESPRHHNSPVDRRHESLQRHSTSSGRHYEALPCYSPVKTDCETSQFPSQSNKFPGKSWKRFHQQNSSVEENLLDSPCYTSRQVNKVENNKMTSTKQLSNSIGNECIRRNLVDRYVDHREFKDSCTTPSKENLRKIKPHKENSFRVEGIEPAKLLESGNKPSKQRFKRNLECKTVSIIGIPSQLRKKYFRNPETIEESVERKKRTKRFKLYYQYSRDNNYYYAESGNSSEGKSVVSDSLRVISDDSECHIEMCKIKKQHGLTDNSECYKKHQKTSVPSNIFSKRSTDRNIIYRDTGKQRHKTSADSKLNNIIEEKTSLSSSGEHKKLNLEIDCKYFRVLQSSSSDYGMGSKNKYGLPFKNDKMNVSEKTDNKVPIKYRDNITNVNKPKRRRDLTNDTLRKTRNTTQKPKEQKEKIISKSDVDISYKSLVGLMKSSIETSEVEKHSSQESSRTPETVVDRKSRTFTGKIDDVKSFIDLGYPKKDDIGIDVKEYVQKLQQIYFGFETLRPQKYFINNEIGIQKCLIDNLTGYSEISKKSNDKTNIDEDHTNGLLRKIYNLIENQNREKSEIAKVFKIDMKEEKEVQVVSCKQDEEISTKDLQSYHEEFEGYTSAEKTNEVKLNKLVMKDVVTQETYARDIGTEMDKNSIRDKEADVSTNILGNKKDVITQKIDANDIGINVHDGGTKKDAKCISNTNILKTDMAVEVNTTEEHVEDVPANLVEDEMNLQRNFKKRNSFGQLPKPKYVAASKIQKIDMAIEVDTTKKYSKDVPEEHLLKIRDPVVEDKMRLPIVHKDGNSPNKLSESKCVSTSLIQKVDLALGVNTAENLFRDILEQGKISVSLEDEMMISRRSTEKSLLSQIPKPKRISTDRVQKIDMAVEVNTTEDYIKDALEDEKLKMKNMSREDRLSQMKVSKEKSSTNQLFKPKCVSTAKIPKADMAVEVNTTEEHMRNIVAADRLKINASLDSKMKQLNVSDESSSLNQLLNPKWGSTAKIQKVDMAVGVNTAETHRLITKDTAIETKINSFRISKEKSSLNQLHKPINEYKPQFVSHKKRKDKREMIQEQVVGNKDDRKEHIQLKSSSVRTKTLKNMKEEHDLYGSCDSKSIKSKMPISKKHMVLDASEDNKPRKKEKSELNGFKASSQLKKSKSEISFRKTHIEAEESKITSLVCLHKYCNIIKYETSSKSNTHSLDHYPSSEHRESSRLFLTKDYRTSDISAYKKRKIYDEAIRRKMRRKAGIQSKTNLAPQVFEVRFVTIDNFHGNFLKNAKTVEKGDFYETNYENTLTRTGYRSKIPECYFEGNLKKNINFTPIKTPMHQLKLWEFYQKALKCPNSYSSCEGNNIIMKAGEALQRNYECLTGKNTFFFIDCICKYLLSENLSNNMNIDENRLDRPISYSLEEYNISSCTDSKEESIADSIASYENEHEKDLINRDNVDNIECVIDRKLEITGNLSCPILRERDSSFDYLYQIESDDKLNNIGTFLNPKKPVNAILGYALNGNTSQTSFKPLLASSLIEVDFEAPCSEESGYSSTRSRHSCLSIPNFFKKPNIAALMKPQSRNWFHSDENLHSEKSTSSTHIFTDYQKMKKQCQEYAHKVTEFSKSKICMDAGYEEIPLEVLIGKQNGLNVIRFRSDSILEKKIESKKKEFAESEPTDYVTQNNSSINLIQKFDCSLQSKDHTQNNQVSVIYENMADNDSCRLKDDDTEEEPHKENDRNLDVTESRSVESLELSEIDSKSDVELLRKILNSEVFLSSTNFSTYCITIVESQNLKSEIHEKSSSSNDVLDDFSALKDEFNEGRKISSNCNILDYKLRKFENSVSKKFFENLLEVYEKEITICSALLEDKNFLENHLLHFAIDKLEKATELSKKSIVRNKMKMFIQKVFHTKNRRKSKPNVFSKSIEEDESTLPPVDVVYQEKLQSLARSAYKYFSMFVQAVEHNHKINDEMKICGLLKLLERIEKGHFKFLRRKESVDFEKEIKDQVKQAFSEIYCKASKEAEINHRKLSANDIHMIATFVCKYRIGLLSRTDLIASYIGQGFFRTEQQLKAVIYIMKQCQTDLNEFQMYCENYWCSNI